jgi:hypothetical protein
LRHSLLDRNLALIVTAGVRNRSRWLGRSVLLRLEPAIHRLLRRRFRRELLLWWWWRGRFFYLRPVVAYLIVWTRNVIPVALVAVVAAVVAAVGVGVEHQQSLA